MKFKKFIRPCMLLAASLIAVQSNAIELVSKTSDNIQANGDSGDSSMNDDGRYVVFSSTANNLFSPYTGEEGNVYLRDRATGLTELVSEFSSAQRAMRQYDDFFYFYYSGVNAISDDGRYVTFARFGLSSGSMQYFGEVYVRDRVLNQTSLISKSSAGEPGNGHSFRPSISADGRYIVFASRADNLVATDTNNQADIFLYDLNNDTMQLISVSSNGNQVNGESDQPVISDDGQLIAFLSQASDLVINDVNNSTDVFVYNRANNSVERVNVSTQGVQANGESSGHPISISGDGRFVSFHSDASNLVALDTNGQSDIFVRDRQNQTTVRASVSSSGQQSNGHSYRSSLSNDGRFVSFHSVATNLVDTDTNNVRDVFVRDLSSLLTGRVSLSDTGEQGDIGSSIAHISGDGRHVSFTSEDAFTSEVTDTSNFKAFATLNPLSIIDLVGTPAIDRTSESGVFIWRTPDGRTMVKVTAGDPAENGQITDYEGNIVSGSMITALTPIGLEASDSLIQNTAQQIDFDLLAQRPWEDRFSFIADETQSLCITLDAYAGGLFLGPDKVEVTPPYDIHGLIGCGPAQLEIVGTPSIDRSSETGAYAWINSNGRTVVKFVAGDPAQGGASTLFSGSVVADQVISSLELISIESSDTVSQSQTNQVDFNVFAIRPWEDRFSFTADTSQSVCISLDDYAGGLFIGPNKTEVTPPFDLVSLNACEDNPTIETDGRPSIDRSSDVGIFIWRNTSAEWVAHVVSGDQQRVIEVDVDSSEAISNVQRVSIESSDVFTQFPNGLDLSLNVTAPWLDGFKFTDQSQATTCVSTTNADVPIYVGPDRVDVGMSIDLETLTACQ